MNLSATRNRIIRINLMVTVAAFALTACIVPASFFGMNINHGVEASAAPLAGRDSIAWCSVGSPCMLSGAEAELASLSVPSVLRGNQSKKDNYMSKRTVLVWRLQDSPNIFWGVVAGSTLTSAALFAGIYAYWQYYPNRRHRRRVRLATLCPCLRPGMQPARHTLQGRFVHVLHLGASGQSCNATHQAQG